MQIPVIDISPLYQANSEQNKHTVAKAIDKACQNSGFFYVTGHPISAQRMQEIQDLSKQFFALPAKEKQKISIKHSANHRGYGETAAEQLDPTKPGDWKETFDMGLNLPADHPLVGPQRPLYGPNQYPVSISDFQETLEHHYWDMLALGKKFSVHWPLP